jgi:hypothetical protein
VRKQDLLLWNKVAVLGLESKVAKVAKSSPSAARDIEYLVDRGFLEALPGTLGGLRSYLKGLPVHDSPKRLILTEREVGFRQPLAELGAVNILNRDSVDLGDGFEQIVADWERSAGFLSIPILRDGNIRRRRGRELSVLDIGQATSPRLVLELILREFPVPGRRVSLRKILDFKESEQATRQLARFIEYLEEGIRAIVQGERSVTTFIAEQRRLLADYQQFMERRRFEITHTRIGALASLPLHVAEDIIRLRFGETIDRIWDSIMTFRMIQFGLSKADENAPGGTRVIAYIDTIQRKFG